MSVGTQPTAIDITPDGQVVYVSKGHGEQPFHNCHERSTRQEFARRAVEKLIGEGRVALNGVTLTGGEPEVIGALRAEVRQNVRSGASPVRWMVVGEARNGFVLRAPGMTTFVLPGPFETPQPQR